MLNNKSNVKFIGFKAMGEWSVAELQTFVRSISKIYGVFLALNLRDKIEYGQPWLLSHTKPREILYQKLIKILRILFHLPPEPKPITATEIFLNLNQYSTYGEQLKIYRIRIGSPGGFSFKGLGEIVKEIREFIKDIWYRNKQEKIRGQLEIINEYLSMRQKYRESNFPPPPAVLSKKELKELVKVLNESVNQIKELESEGKLKDIAENIDYLPE